ncbi:hypothetical protein GBA65_02790 [Rubrobacter marinus]|uniref:DUF5666 domain-containing protein n=1 Tax=Rubrobacter marinus TaxID=2653852 RepID=A0A6G8PUF1_9ACTN|nr:hypothetical protein [Rubrobacter marinus]QIN77611.1 hypothetical protein GBA65_02790 [Rubrobacter marinus]
MSTKAMIAVLGVLASVALVAGLVRPGSAESGGEDGDNVVRAGSAVVDGADARIEDGPSVEGDEATVGEGESAEEDEAEESEGATPGDGEVVLRMRGDEGVEFSGTCSVGGEEREMEGQVPDEFTFALDGDELECEVRKEGEGTLKMVLVSENDRIVQKVSGDSTMKFAYSGNGSSSSTTSVSGSSNVVTQSSSSVSSSSVQSSASSTSD